MKISIIGAGNIGSNIVSQLLCKDFEISQIALIDIFGDLAKARALDLSHLASVYNKKTEISGSSDEALLANSDIVVITAGKTRQAGQSRADLLNDNAKIISSCAKNVAKYAPEAIIILITNPVDTLAFVAYKASGFKKEKIIAMAGELDSARLRYEIAKSENVNVTDIKASVVGAHNDEMQILEDEIYKFGKKFKPQNLSLIKENTINSGSKITALQKTSSFFAPAACSVKMIDAIINDKNEILICSVLDENEIPIGRFVKLNKNGVAEILPFDYGEKIKSGLENIKRQILNLNKGKV